MAMIRTAYDAPAGTRRLQTLVLGVAVVAAVVAALAYFVDPDTFTVDQLLQSYMTGWLYWLAISLGCLGLLLIQYVSGGVWGATLRRFFEAGAASLGLLAVLFIPIWLSVLLGNDAVFPWVNHELMESSEVLEHKQWWLNAPSFLIRTPIYFAFLLFVTYRLVRLSRRRDEEPGSDVSRRTGRFAAPMLVLWMVVMTILGTDFVMSIQPEWYSTIYPAVYGITGVLLAMALGIVWLAVLSTRGPLRPVIGAEHYHDLGNWLLAFTIIWTYFNLSQFLIIWSGNLPVEIAYYTRRFRGAWFWISQFLIYGGFWVPFLLLLSRPLKRNGRWLAPVAVYVLVVQFVYTLYLTVPAFHEEGLALTVWDLALPLAIGGLWGAFFLWRLRSAPLLPINAMPEHHPRDHRIHTRLEHADAGH